MKEYLSPIERHVLAWSKAEHTALLFINGEYFRFDENDVS